MSSVTRSACTSDLIPLGQKVAYAAGMLVNNLQAAAMPAMMVVLNLGIGLDPRLVGIIGFIPRIFDAVSDPLMGYVSDNTRSRWGRRRPYIFIVLKLRFPEFLPHFEKMEILRKKLRTQNRKSGFVRHRRYDSGHLIA